MRELSVRESGVEGVRATPPPQSPKVLPRGEFKDSERRGSIESSRFTRVPSETGEATERHVRQQT